jgi:glycosyltransferase involved in cell wall biosynthesis
MRTDHRGTGEGNTILIVTERFHPEEFRINDLALEWRKRGYGVKVLTQFPSYPFGKLFDGYTNALYRKETWNGIEIHRVWSVMGYTSSVLKKMFNYATHAVLGSVCGIFMGRGIGAIFVYHTGPLTNVIPAIVAKKVHRKKITIWTTDIWPDAVFAYGFKKTPARERFLGAFVRWVFSNCDQILVSSRGFIKRLQQYIPGEMIHYVPYWADGVIQDGSGVGPAIVLSEEKRCHFTFAGNIGKMQNLENVIRGFARITDNKNVQLNIIGDGSDAERLRERVRSEGIENVIFWGRKPAREMPGFYRQSDVLVISLKSDPFLELTVPGKFQTYLCTGKPVYAIMKGEVKEMVEDCSLGLTADPDDLEEIKRGFEHFASLGKEKLNEYGVRCVQLHDRKFNRENIINRITAYLDFAEPC